MAQSLLLEEFGIVPSAGRRTHPKAAAHPSHKVWPVLPASRCSTSCTPTISATVFSIVGLHAACLRSGWCNTGTAPEVCALARRESWRETGASDGRRRVGHIVIERCRKQRALPAIQPFDKALHQMPRKSSGNLIARITANRAFSHTLGPELPVDLLGANVGFRRKTRLWQEPP